MGADLGFLSNTQLQDLASNVASQMADGGGRHIKSAGSGDVSVEKEFGIPLAQLSGLIAAEMRRRGLLSALKNRTRVRFS